MAKQPTEKRKTLTLDPETHRKLRIYAAKTGKQMMQIMESALAEFMKKKK
ncbi:MAG TPA: hypothetical protein P5040_04155 [Smithella sp.]|mgnify:CR=1 FL=1|nr:hypothetical protein [Smithella sp.]